MPLRLHFLLGWILVVATLGLVGFWLPPSEKTIGESYLIFFFHFPSAVTCLTIFLMAGGYAVAHLIGKRATTDLATASGVEVGLLACTVTLVTGSIWARAAWGIWWDATDPRLMSVAILWLTFAAYVVLRANIEEPVQRGRFCSAFAAVAALNVFFVYFAIRMFGQSHHPMDIALGERSMVVTRWFGAFSFFVLYTAFWRLRYGVLTAGHEARSLEERLVDLGA